MFQTHTESIVPESGVTTSIIPMVDVRPPNVLTYATLVYAAWWASVETFDPSASWMSAALRIFVYLDWVLVGKITMVPSNSSASTSRLIGSRSDMCDFVAISPEIHQSRKSRNVDHEGPTIKGYNDETTQNSH